MDDIHHRPRKCIIKKWEHFNGFGFHINELKGEAGHFVGRVEEDSPAKSAHLLEGDRIIEINGFSLAGLTHGEAVARVRKNPNMLTMLVVDASTDRFYHQRGIRVHGEMEEIQLCEGMDSSDAHERSLIEAKDHRPRKCLLRKWDNFSGYGFHLHKDKSRPDHVVSVVVPGSPAHSAHLKTGDRIVEINGLNVVGLAHKQVVRRTREHARMLTLLVVDAETDRYYQRKGMRVHGELEEIEYFEAGQNAGEKEDEEEQEEEDEEQRIPRLCLIRRWEDFEGYGFDLHVLASRTIHLVGRIDKGSPAEAGGLQEGDAIIEVNGTNVEKESHEDLIGSITANPDQVVMLVLPHRAHEYYQKQGITIHSEMPEVEIIQCPPHKTTICTTSMLDVEWLNGKRRGRRLTLEPVVEDQDLASDSDSTHEPEEDVPKPRLCLIRRWQEFQGYGFDLHVIKGETFHLVGAIDTCSPAEAAGLEEGDVIVEVNGNNVETENHHALVQHIKEYGTQVQMLVIAYKGYEYYKKQNIKIHSGMPGVILIDEPAYEPPEEI